MPKGAKHHLIRAGFVNMALSKEQTLEERARDASSSDKIVLAVLHQRPSRTTSIQKLGLLVRAAVEGRVPPGYNPHFFGGFDDDIDSSLEELREEGYIFEGADGTFALSPSGVELTSRYLSDATSQKIKETSEKIVGRMVHLSDRDILAIAYEMFPELTDRSLIRDRVHPIRRVKNAQVITIPR